MLIYMGFSLVIIWYLYEIFYHKKALLYKDKNVLVIGGSSGLGLEIARLTKKMGAIVTIASRNPQMYSTEFLTVIMDICDSSTFQKENTKYDFIFCCAGYSKPGYFKDLKPNHYRQQMDMNYFGTINVLFHFYEFNKRPLNFIMIASTVCYLTFPGYSAYSPSKAALKSFFDSAFYEMKKENIFLYIYYVNSMKTPGFENENKTKPEFTKIIEGVNGMDPLIAAKILINGMNKKNEITSDILTNILKNKSEAYSFYDFLLLLVSMIVYPIVRIYIYIQIKCQK